jgi:hypothetical protein
MTLVNVGVFPCVCDDLVLIRRTIKTLSYSRPTRRGCKLSVGGVWTIVVVCWWAAFEGKTSYPTTYNLGAGAPQKKAGVWAAAAAQEEGHTKLIFHPTA